MTLDYYFQDNIDSNYIFGLLDLEAKSQLSPMYFYQREDGNLEKMNGKSPLRSVNTQIL